MKVSVHKEYRTRNGCPVRALRYDRRDHHAVVKGKMLKTGLRENIIRGEVFTNDGISAGKVWLERVWSESGEDTTNEDLDLVEYTPEVKNQLALL